MSCLRGDLGPGSAVVLAPLGQQVRDAPARADWDSLQKEQAGSQGNAKLLGSRSSQVNLSSFERAQVAANRARDLVNTSGGSVRAGELACAWTHHAAMLPETHPLRICSRAPTADHNCCFDLVLSLLTDHQTWLRFDRSVANKLAQCPYRC